MSTLKVLLYVLLLGTATTPVLAACIPGFTAFQEYCYAVIKVKVTWPEATRLCESFKAKLAWIDSDAENQFIQGMLSRHHDALPTDEVWTAGTDLLLEGQWLWADTLDPINYTDWAPGEPNDTNGQHCIGLLRDSGFKWDDNQCDKKMVPLCKARCTR